MPGPAETISKNYASTRLYDSTRMSEQDRTSGATAAAVRRFPVGAEIQPGRGVDFRVWAPERRKVDVVVGTDVFPLQREPSGYFSGNIADVRAGDLYRYRLDSEGEFPDPASRFQPDGPHGSSQVVDPRAYRWRDTGWNGRSIAGQVIYEMHTGTFTREGTWRAALEHLPELARIGITVLEVMPAADFSGTFGWGYDGVNLFAPTRLYGTPDELREFIDAAHQLGLAVILDVVYNHFGADGNYAGVFSPSYFSKMHKTDWGQALNYDGEHSGPVREFVISNAIYWIDEYHFDGLRIDATQDIHDESPRHILEEITRAVREAAGPRATILIGENEPQDAKLLRPLSRGGYGMDGLWNDDLHHTACVALTGRKDAYYMDYKGTPQEFVSAMKYGFLYQGQWYRWQNKRRGTPALDIAPNAFVTFTQNHDQVANSARGERIHTLTSLPLYRSVTAVLLLGPGTPMLFQGQEFGASSPFLYFADAAEHLRESVCEGRREFLSQWRALRTPEMHSELPDPCARETFERSKLDHAERERNAQMYAFHCDVLDLRRRDPVLGRTRHFDGAVLAEAAFVFRYFDAHHGDRLIVVNLGPDLHVDPAPEPLLAPPVSGGWRLLLSTEHPRYGGTGTPPPDTNDNWQIPGRCALVLAGSPQTEHAP
jgi:maltooligosyltrehalose trehalohydrolase